MSFLDKAKAAAAKVAEGAQKGAQQVQEKVEQTQTHKKANDLAEQLGYLIVRERSGGEPAGAAADELVSQILALEAQLEASKQESAAPEPADAAPAPAPAPSPEPAPASPPAAAASEPTPGDFTLD